MGIFDHHKLGGLKTDEPLEVIVKPWGSTATIVFDEFKRAGTQVESALAGLILSAILSDTRLDDDALIGMDFKIFRMGKHKVGVAQLEAFDALFLIDRLANLKTAMEKKQAKNSLDAMVLAVTDVSRGGSTILAVGPKADVAQSALGLSAQPLGTFVPAVLSRKRQIIPPLEKAFAQ